MLSLAADRKALRAEVRPIPRSTRPKVSPEHSASSPSPKLSANDPRLHIIKSAATELARRRRARLKTSKDAHMDGKTFFERKLMRHGRGRSAFTRGDGSWSRVAAYAFLLAVMFGLKTLQKPHTFDTAFPFIHFDTTTSSTSSPSTPSTLSPTSSIADHTLLGWGWPTPTLSLSSLLPSASRSSYNLSFRERRAAKKVKNANSRARGAAAAELVEYYKEVSSDYATPETTWPLITTSNGISVYMSTGATNAAVSVIRVELDINAPLEYAAHQLQVEHWSDTQAMQDPFFDKWELLHDLGVVGKGNGQVAVKMGRRLTKRLLTFGRRDLVLGCFEEKGIAKEGRWLRLGFLSVSHPYYPPAVGKEKKKSKYVRAYQNMFIDFKEAVDAADDKVTKVVCWMQVDLGGYIPKFIFQKTVGHTAVMAFKKVRAKAVELVKSNHYEL